jgi:hypothetical protein
MASLALSEYFRLLHIPTTSSVLAFALIGSISASVIYLDRLMWILLQLFLVVGVAANFLDEIHGRPWHTKIPNSNLWIIALSALSASTLIGIYLTLVFTWWFLIFIAIWEFFAIAYDLELFKGFFHNTPSLALSGGSVCLGSYYLQNPSITPQILIISLLTGCIAGQGRNLYEVAKQVCKDKTPLPHKASQFAWTLLKSQILFMDFFAVTMLILKILPIL